MVDVQKVEYGGEGEAGGFLGNGVEVVIAHTAIPRLRIFLTAKYPRQILTLSLLKADKGLLHIA
jgi:hypothetical protein